MEKNILTTDEELSFISGWHPKVFSWEKGIPNRWVVMWLPMVPQMLVKHSETSFKKSTRSVSL